MNTLNHVPDIASTYKRQVPSYIDRNFSNFRSHIARKHKCFIDMRRQILDNFPIGKSYRTLEVVVRLARKFGNDFYMSDEQMLSELQYEISHPTLKRDKSQLMASGILHISHGVKNKSQYHLRIEKIDTLILNYLSELGVQQAQNDLSHIIDNSITIQSSLKLKDTRDKEIKLTENNNEIRNKDLDTREDLGYSNTIPPDKQLPERPVSEKEAYLMNHMCLTIEEATRVLDNYSAERIRQTIDFVLSQTHVKSRRQYFLKVLEEGVNDKAKDENAKKHKQQIEFKQRAQQEYEDTKRRLEEFRNIEKAPKETGIAYLKQIKEKLK